MAHLQTIDNELNELEAHRLNIKKELSDKYPEYCLWNNTNLFVDYIKAAKAGVFNSVEWKMLLILNSKIYNLKDLEN